MESSGLFGGGLYFNQLVSPAICMAYVSTNYNYLVNTVAWLTATMFNQWQDMYPSHEQSPVGEPQRRNFHPNTTGGATQQQFNSIRRAGDGAYSLPLGNDLVQE